ncbi:hypothetical protein H6P81_014647 [Aristolochia fimbriata]|uniref:Import inner membrane translocase subunit n=1 Tax=Aristolochia fimbriata TaxID=158543 RepID=A0AAV7E766_ARIFI|nr:hypothetical protein H6P81_014647 [Aristolochia fimbriata]
MARQTKAIIVGLRRGYLDSFLPKSPSSGGTFSHRFSTQSLQDSIRSYVSGGFSSGFLNSSRLTSFHGLPSKPISPNGHSAYQSAKSYLTNSPSDFYKSGLSNSRRLMSGIPSKASEIRTGALVGKTLRTGKGNGNSFGTRFFCSGSSESRKINVGFAKAIFDKPASAVKSSFRKYREALGLHIEALWKRYSLVFVGAAALAVCILLWRIMFGIASTFVELSEGLAKYGFLALASTIVAFVGLYIRSRFTINPDRVYRIAMRKLNTSAPILEVMGAPLSGTDLRAYVMSGGGPQIKKFKPRLSGKRCFLIFPIRGSERKGLVSVEVKKKKGQYDMKLLAVDIPMTSGPDQRLFLIGDETEYQIGGGLISELRDPIVKAMAAEKEFDALDEKEEEEDAEREIQEAERKRLEEIEKLEKSSS